MSTIDAILTDAKRAATGQDYEKAVNLYSEACGMYAESHDGEDSPDLLFYYGETLFKLAVKNAGFVNSEEVEKKQLPMENSHVSLAAEEEEEEAAEKKDASKDKDVKDGEGETGETGEQESEVVVGSSVAEGAEEDGNDDDENDGENEDDGDDDEDDDFKAAWKIIDLCRVLYLKDNNEPKLADTYALLGDIAIEDDNYPQAKQDFAAALELKQKLYKDDDKLLAAANYMLALAEELSNEKPAALNHMKVAARLTKNYDPEAAKDLQYKVHELEQDIAKKDKSAESGKIHEAALNIGGREAISEVLTKILSGASDISSFARKRTRPTQGKSTNATDDNKKPKSS